MALFSLQFDYDRKIRALVHRASLDIYLSCKLKYFCDVLPFLISTAALSFLLKSQYLET
jgi:hypothetical protein